MWYDQKMSIRLSQRKSLFLLPIFLILISPSLLAQMVISAKEQKRSTQEEIPERFRLDEFSKTQLMYAVWAGNVEEVRKILKDAKTNLTPSQYRTYINHTETGKSVLSYAVFAREYGYVLNGKSVESVPVSRRLELLQVLMDAGVELYSEEISTLEHAQLLDFICQHSTDNTRPTRKALIELAQKSSPLRSTSSVGEKPLTPDVQKKIASLEKCKADTGKADQTYILKSGQGH